MFCFLVPKLSGLCFPPVLLFLRPLTLCLANCFPSEAAEKLELQRGTSSEASIAVFWRCMSYWGLPSCSLIVIHNRISSKGLSLLTGKLKTLERRLELKSDP